MCYHSYHSNGSDSIRILKMIIHRTRLTINIAIGVSPMKQFENHCLPSNANQIECKYFLVVLLESLGSIYIKAGFCTGSKAKRSLRVQNNLKNLQFKVEQWIKCREREDTCFIKHNLYSSSQKRFYSTWQRPRSWPNNRILLCRSNVQ